jgi:integrase
MAVIKNENTGKWEVRTYYKDAFTGERKQKTKRGFKKKSEAKAWEEAFKLQRDENLDMTMKAFVEIYLSDISPRLKENTLMTKRYIIDEKILPYFAHKKLQEIKPSDVIKWQNEIMSQVSGHGRPYSPVYLKTIHNQLSTIFNHAEKLYGLQNNPARQAGNMGKERNGEMLFWTKEEYLQFIEGVADKPMSYYAFQILYWCGLRCGDAHDKISLNQQKPSKYAGLRRFSPEKILQRSNEFMKERPIFYKNQIEKGKNFSHVLRYLYHTTKGVKIEYSVISGLN